MTKVRVDSATNILLTSLAQLALGVVLLVLPSAGYGATLPVSDVAGFQAALTTAQANGEDDIITVAAGIYDVTSTLSYDSIEDFSLIITGAGMGNTTLDGGNPAGGPTQARQILSLVTSGTGASLSVQGMTLRDGLSPLSAGGALHIETASGSISISQCEINDSSVTGTDDETIGGGVAAIAGSGQITLTGSIVRRNTSTGNVGGLYASSGSSITLSDSVFEDNSVANAGTSDYFGDGGGAMLYGPVEAAGQTIQVDGCIFNRNVASGGDNADGGGLMVYQNGANVSGEVTGCTFNTNQSGLGGAGLFMRINSTGTMICTDNEFTGNIAGTPPDGDGGGANLFHTTGNVTVTGNTFDGNEAAWDGGGMWISVVDGDATITHNIFNGNTASANNGGGLSVFTENAGSTSTLTNNVYLGNTANTVGGGLSYATTNGDLVLRASTFSENTAAGGGAVYVYSEAAAAPAPELGDLILWNDTPDELDFSGAGTAVLTVLYSDVDAGTGETWFGTGCIDTDPMFVDVGTGDLRLSWDNYPVDDATRSPCIDAGDPASPLDNDGTRADMGALSFGDIFADGFESGDATTWSVVVQ